MTSFSSRTYNELYIGTKSGKSIIDSNMNKCRQSSITWATKNNRIYYFDPRRSIIITPSSLEKHEEFLEYESESEYESEDEMPCINTMCVVS